MQHLGATIISSGNLLKKCKKCHYGFLVFIIHGLKASEKMAILNDSELSMFKRIGLLKEVSVQRAEEFSKKEIEHEERVVAVELPGELALFELSYNPKRSFARWASYFSLLLFIHIGYFRLRSGGRSLSLVKLETNEVFFSLIFTSFLTLIIWAFSWVIIDAFLPIDFPKKKKEIYLIPTFLTLGKRL